MINITGLQMGHNSAQIQPKINETFICSCGKQYQHMQCLSRHKICYQVNTLEYALFVTLGQHIFL